MGSVLILSDSHGWKQEITEIVSRHTVDKIIHCGDSELDFDAPELEGMHKVRGNCNFDSRFPTEVKVHIDGLNFYIVHGHLHRVKEGLLTLKYRAEEEDADIVCFGHTHIAGAEQIGERIFINPGSIRYPRMRKEATYAIISWDDKRKVQIRFFTVDGNELTDLSLEGKLEK